MKQNAPSSAGPIGILFAPRRSAMLIIIDDRLRMRRIRHGGNWPTSGVMQSLIERQAVFA